MKKLFVYGVYVLLGGVFLYFASQTKYVREILGFEDYVSASEIPTTKLAKPSATNPQLLTPTKNSSPTSSPKLTATLLPLPTSTHVPLKTYLTIKANHVALRAGPNINHPEITKLYDKGTQMEILGSYEDWYYVRAPDDNVGWLFNGWLNITGIDLTDLPKIESVPTPPLPTPAPKPKPKPGKETYPTETYPTETYP